MLNTGPSSARGNERCRVLQASGGFESLVQRLDLRVRSRARLRNARPPCRRNRLVLQIVQEDRECGLVVSLCLLRRLLAGDHAVEPVGGLVLTAKSVALA